MGKIAIYGAGQAGRMVLKWLPGHREAVCFLDRDPAKQGENIDGVPVRAPEELTAVEWESLTEVVVAVMKREAAEEITADLRRLGFRNKVTGITSFRDTQDVRLAVLRLYAQQIREKNVPGAAAELGVFRGDFSEEINREFPDRQIFLFDTFEGFDAADIAAEDQKTAQHPYGGRMDFSGTDAESVRARLPHPEQAVFVKGRFPESLSRFKSSEARPDSPAALPDSPAALPEQFALVSLDVDLYEPTRQGLEWFWPRMSEGGIILIHDYTGTQYPGVKRAADEFCLERNLHLLPLPDLHGTAVLMKQDGVPGESGEDEAGTEKPAASVRRIVLMRHGEREHSHESRYVGRTDDPLTEHGAFQAFLSGKWLAKNMPSVGKIYASPIPRCVRTADEAGRAMGFAPEEIEHVDGLQEVYLGEWENKTRAEMLEADPERVRERESHLGSFVFPGGESFIAGGARLMNTINALRARTDGDFLVVTHAGVLRGYLALLRQVDADQKMDDLPPCAGMIILEDSSAYAMPRIAREPFAPEERLDDEEELSRLYTKYGTPEPVIRHMRKVAQTAEDIMRRSAYNGDRLRPVRAAMVHDLLRAQPDHEQAGAAALIKEGYRELAPIVALHNDENIDVSGDGLTAAEILYLADKLSAGDRSVTLEERFEKSRAKCVTPEALAHHEARYRKARAIQDKVERLARREDSAAK